MANQNNTASVIARGENVTNQSHDYESQPLLHDSAPMYDPSNKLSENEQNKKGMGCCGHVGRQIWLIVFFGLFLGLGIFTAVFWDGIFTNILHKQFSIDNTDTKGFKNWKETPIPMYLSIYLFNWTNAVLFTKDKLKPKFEELGPYVFYEHHVRENVTHNDNDTVTFYNRRTWRFEPSMSIGTLEDRIIMLNPVAVMVSDMVKQEHYLVRRAVNLFLEEYDVGITVTKTVGEVLFKGYEDPLLDMALKLNMTKLKIPYKTFGWFVDRNNSVTFDGIFNMYSGGNDWSKEGIVYSWNYMNQTPYYPGTCGVIKGTTGELWYPTKDDQEVYLFANDLCSSVNMHLNGTMEKHGVKGNIYVSRDDIFDNGTVYPEKSCFAIPGIHNGVRSVSSCKFNAPAYLSLPHFYMADPYFRSKVEGMNPDPQKHSTHIALEPSLGLPLEVKAGFQLNLMMSNVPGINIFNDVKDTMMPCMWFVQTAELSPELATLAKTVLKAKNVPVYVGYALLALAACLFVYFLYLRLWRKKSTDQTALISETSYSEGLDNNEHQH